MPIKVEGDVTLQEVESILTPEIIPHITAAMTAKKYTVLDEAGKTAYENNLRTNVTSELTSQHATSIEKDIFEQTGIEKKAGEKWFDYNKRALAQVKTQGAELANLKSKTDLSAAERQRISELEGLQTKWGEEKQSLTNSHQSEVTKLKAENKIYSEIGKVDAKLKKTPELQEAIQIVRANKIQKMIDSAKFQDGKIVFFGADGKARTNPDASFMTAEQIYTEEMGNYIDKAPVVGGAGGDGGSDPTPVGNFKTQHELNTFLSAKGLTTGTPEYQKEFKRLNGDKLPIRL